MKIEHLLISTKKNSRHPDFVEGSTYALFYLFIQMKNTVSIKICMLVSSIFQDATPKNPWILRATLNFTLLVQINHVLTPNVVLFVATVFRIVFFRRNFLKTSKNCLRKFGCSTKKAFSNYLIISRFKI